MKDSKTCRAGEIRIGDKCHSKLKIEKLLNITAGEFATEPIGNILLAMKRDDIVSLFDLAQEQQFME